MKNDTDECVLLHYNQKSNQYKYINAHHIEKYYTITHKKNKIKMYILGPLPNVIDVLSVAKK